MATLSQLADEYADAIRSAIDEQAAIIRIADEISGLYYETSGIRLTRETKLYLVDLIHDKLNRPVVVGDNGLTLLLKEADNKKYLALVKALKDLL